jgi:hypothetical protein
VSQTESSARLKGGELGTANLMALDRRNVGLGETSYFALWNLGLALA